jgi:hypothetical protein
VTWFVLSWGESGAEKPWVVAEVMDEWWAREAAAAWPDMIVLSETEAVGKPTFRQALDDWRQRDFSAYAADAARREKSWPHRDRPAAQLPLGFRTTHPEPPSSSSSPETASRAAP